MENKYISGTIKLSFPNEKGKQYLKYSFIKNRESSIKKFISFAQKIPNAEYINFYTKDRVFIRRETLQALHAKL